MVACTTNLCKDIDPAALRRFVFKVEFRPLEPDEALRLFEDVLGRRLEGEEAGRVRTGLARLPLLAPGDLAAVRRRLAVLGCGTTPEDLLRHLEADVSMKGGPRRAMGF